MNEYDQQHLDNLHRSAMSLDLAAQGTPETDPEYVPRAAAAQRAALDLAAAHRGRRQG